MTTVIVNTPQGNRKIHVDESIDEVQDKWLDALHGDKQLKLSKWDIDLTQDKLIWVQ